MSNERAIRRMPQKFNTGQHHNTCMASPMHNQRTWERDGSPNPHGLRAVMGFFLPSWQRGFVWSEAQQISFIESAWRGIGLGTYTINRVEQIDHPLDNIIIDGQQRMHAIERYLADAFPIFGWHWSEVTEVDRRYWELSTAFASYETRSEDEGFLRGYYDMMNFGGTKHSDDQRAVPAAPEASS